MNTPGLVPLIVGGTNGQSTLAQSKECDCDKGCDCYDTGPCYDVECDRAPDPE